MKKMTLSRWYGNRIYAAERILSLYSKPIASVEEAQRMVDKAWASKRWQKEFPFIAGHHKPVVITTTGGTSYAHKWGKGDHFGPTIALSKKYGFETRVLWHEVAHHLAFAFNDANAGRRIHGQSPIPFEKGHGPVFAQLLARTVRLQMGLEAVRALRWSFRSWRVRTADFEQDKVRLRPYRGEVKEEWLIYSRDHALAKVNAYNEEQAAYQRRQEEEEEIRRAEAEKERQRWADDTRYAEAVERKREELAAERKRLVAQNERVMAMVERSKRAAADGTA
jgi:hypothetical protein